MNEERLIFLLKSDEAGNWNCGLQGYSWDKTLNIMECEKIVGTVLLKVKVRFGLTVSPHRDLFYYHLFFSRNFRPKTAEK